MDRTEPLGGATPPNDTSGLKLSPKRRWTLKEIQKKEAENIARATLRYFAAPPTKKTAPFDYAWLLQLHEEMFGDVWEWAGKLRQNELSIGISAYLVPTELKKLVDDLRFWEANGTYPLHETAARLHHRAVWIHPFQNGNGRWARMLANIYLYSRGSSPVKWQEDLLAEKNPKRDAYIAALKKADEGDFSDLVALHMDTY